MEKKLLIIILTIFLSGSVGLTQPESTQENWRTGTQGVVMNFVPDTPPSEVVSTSDILVYIEYSNKGASKAEELAFYLTGFDDSILNQFEWMKSHDGPLVGKTRFNPEGSQEYILKWSSDITMDSLEDTDSFKQAFVVTACYKYATRAYPMICIDPTQFDVIGPTECDYSVKDLGASQGAPIVVTKVEKKMSKDKIFLEIEFQNKGNGNSYIKGDCIALKYNQIDRITVKEVGDGKFTCNPSDVRLVNNKGFTICESNKYFNMPDGRSEIQVPILLEYSYRKSLPKKEITIVNVES